MRKKNENKTFLWEAFLKCITHFQCNVIPTYLDEVCVGEKRVKYGLIYEKYNFVRLVLQADILLFFFLPVLLRLLLFVIHMMNAWAYLSKTAAESIPLIKVKRNSPLLELVAVLAAFTSQVAMTSHSNACSISVCALFSHYLDVFDGCHQHFLSFHHEMRALMPLTYPVCVPISHSRFVSLTADSENANKCTYVCRFLA